MVSYININFCAKTPHSHKPDIFDRKYMTFVYLKTNASSKLFLFFFQINETPLMLDIILHLHENANSPACFFLLFNKDHFMFMVMIRILIVHPQKGKTVACCTVFHYLLINVDYNNFTDNVNSLDYREGIQYDHATL